MTAVNNREVVAIFEKIADMLAIRGDQIHRILAYRRAAESIASLGRDINQVYAEGTLTDIPNIGTTLAAKIEELLTTGELAFYDRLSADIPPSLVDLLRVEGLGPKRVKQIYDVLHITTLEELSDAAEEGQLSSLPRMGAKTEQKILAGIEALTIHGDDRTLLGEAWPIAQAILAELSRVEGVEQVAVGGSLRRMRETIGDIDLLVAAEDADPVMDRFSDLSIVESVSARGPTRSRVVLHNGLGVDLRVLPAENWGTLLSYFTGSLAHNVRLRELAQAQGLSLNEYSFTPVDGSQDTVCPDEICVYQKLGLPFIPPTLREDRGEIEAALAGNLPQLIQNEDIVADLHMHTTWSDGKFSVLEMAQAARADGLAAVAITDHSYSLGITNGLTVDRLRDQAAEVKAADEAMGPDFWVLHGTEMEIRADGTLDFPDDVLAQLDFVIASLHTSLSQPKEQVTERLLKAIYNPYVHMIAHPTGRLLPDRPGADLDMDAIFRAAAETGTFLEINANPRRLDLRDSHVRRALELGVRLSINTDAHRPDQLKYRHYGVATAQRGWATAADIINAWPLKKLLAILGFGP